MPMHLRPEARPAKWEHLDRQQKQAFAMLVKMIGEAVRQLPLEPRSAPPEFEEASWLSGKRSSRTVFLSGARGTGKTTLLASIISETTGDLRRTPLTLDPSAKNDPELTDREFFECLRLVRDRVIWLEPIDMETMPPEANLLSAILARIDDGVRRVGAAERGAEPESETRYRPQGLLTAEYHDALLQLQRLQTDSALAWDSNLEARKAQLDPDSYAVEVQRCERARLSINHKLETVLNALVSQPLAGSVRSRLFLLPVDDVDLNPLACLDLLKLLRMISVPRLFTLLLGDVQVADLVLNLKLSNDLARLFIDVRQPDFLALEPVLVGTMAGDIAANALRKLLPPSQRISLLPMSLLEGLNFLPLGHPATDLRLHELLGKCRLHLQVPLSFLRPPPSSPPGPIEDLTLRDFLLAEAIEPSAPLPPPRAADGELKLTGNYLYTGHLLFRAPPRRLADYWLMLHALMSLPAPPGAAEQEGGGANDVYEELVGHFARLCKGSLAGDPNLLPHERAQVETGIALNSKDEWELRRLPLRVWTDIEREPAIEPTLVNFPPHTMRFIPARDKGWRIDVTAEETRDPWGGSPRSQPPPAETGEEDRARAGRILTGSVVAELMIFHDLLALGRERGAAYLSSALLLPRPLTGPGWMVTEWQDEKGHSAKLPWPTPPLRSFWENDFFLSAWNRWLQEASPTYDWDLRVQGLLGVWLGFGTAAVDHEMPVSAPQGTPIGGLLVPRLESTVLLARRTYDWRWALAKEWLVNVALLFMPESGLPGDIVQPFANSPGLREFWREHHQTIVRHRASRLAEFIRHEMADLAERLRVAQTPLGDFQPSSDLVNRFTGAGAGPGTPPPGLPPTPPTGGQGEDVRGRLEQVQEQLAALNAKFDSLRARRAPKSK